MTNPQDIEPRLSQSQKNPGGLSPERRELHEKITRLRTEANPVDFSIVEALRELRA